jgi:hypothetical protein
MNTIKKILSALPIALLLTILAHYLALFKVTFIFGSISSAFSAINLVGPLMGMWFGSVVGGLFLVLNAIRYLLKFGSIPLRALATVYHVPTLFASAYWSPWMKTVRLALPLLCMVFFIAHPEGRQAFPYALYWLIPVALYWKKERNIFLDCLGSTFIAHAVGSIIWLYTGPMTAAQWMALIPLVCIERLTFATSMALVSVAVSWVQRYVRNSHTISFLSSLPLISK